MPISVSDPTLWAARMLEYLDKSFVYGAAFTNRNYEGEIQEAGSTVRILQIGDIVVSDFTGTLPAPQGLSDTALDLVIDQRKYFNFVVDDVDAKRSILRLIDELVGQGLSILLISSELEELVAVSDRVIVVRDRAHVAELVGEAITTDAIVAAIAAPSVASAAGVAA